MLASDILYIFLEGDDDERFFKGVLESKLLTQYSEIKSIKWAEKKEERINNYLKSIKAKNQDYIFCTDLDDCTEEQKTSRITEKRFEVDPSNLVIVIKMIESWYIAGLDQSVSKKLGVHKCQKSCDKICKGKFSSIRPKRFETNTDFMIEILKVYSIAHARKNSKSFDSLYRRVFKNIDGRA